MGVIYNQPITTRGVIPHHILSPRIHTKRIYYFSMSSVITDANKSTTTTTDITKTANRSGIANGNSDLILSSGHVPKHHYLNPPKALERLWDRTFAELVVRRIVCDKCI